MESKACWDEIPRLFPRFFVVLIKLYRIERLGEGPTSFDQSRT